MKNLTLSVGIFSPNMNSGALADLLEGLQPHPCRLKSPEHRREKLLIVRANHPPFMDSETRDGTGDNDLAISRWQAGGTKQIAFLAKNGEGRKEEATQATTNK